MTKSVKVLLLSDIPHLGHKDEVKSVAMGFAKNWLIRRNLASLASPKIIALAQQRRSVIEVKQQEAKAKYETLAKELEGLTLRLRPKKNKQGTLYEGIDALAIAQKLKEKKVIIAPNLLQLEQPIKQIGEYDVTVALSKDYQTKIKVIVQ